MTAPTVSFVSLGCPKNLVDSEKMLGLLAEAGCGIVGDGAPGDVVVINTCGFLAASRDEAVGIIRETAEQKRAGDVRRIVVAGCLVQRDGQSLLDAVPEIDALVGVNNRADIVRAVLGDVAAEMRGDNPPITDGSANGNGANRIISLGEYHPQSWSDRTRLRLTPRHYAYLRMSEGCNQKCTFCTIPSIRGLMYCKPVDEIMAEARELLDDGAVEINLIGQDTTSYLSAPAAGGDDLNLAGLIRKLNTLDGAAWIRLMYAYPTDFTDEMIDAVSACDRIAKYIDIPLQHINDRVLKSMHRRVTRRRTESLLAKLRDRIPGIAIRTTFIAGFPGETEAEFEELCDFVRDFGFDAMGVFPYSLEPDTPAGRMKEQLNDGLKQERADALMEIQQQVAFDRADAVKGKRFDVMIDDYGRDGVYPARHMGQAPEIDSVTYVVGGEFDPGDIVNVKCTGRDDYDLIAEPVTTGLPVLG